MTEFSFTMSDGSMLSWNAPDPELYVLGRDRSEDTSCYDDDFLIETIDNLLNHEYTSGKLTN